MVDFFSDFYPIKKCAKFSRNLTFGWNCVRKVFLSIKIKGYFLPGKFKSKKDYKILLRFPPSPGVPENPFTEFV